MKQFAFALVATIIAYSFYFVTLEYVIPHVYASATIYIDANSGLLFGLLPAIVLIAMSLYFWLVERKPYVGAGLFAGFLLFIVVLQFLLAGT